MLLDGDVQLSCFGLEILFLDKFARKTSNCLIKMKLAELDGNGDDDM